MPGCEWPELTVEATRAPYRTALNPDHEPNPRAIDHRSVLPCPNIKLKFRCEHFKTGTLGSAEFSALALLLAHNRWCNPAAQSTGNAVRMETRPARIILAVQLLGPGRASCNIVVVGYARSAFFCSAVLGIGGLVEALVSPGLVQLNNLFAVTAHRYSICHETRARSGSVLGRCPGERVCFVSDRACSLRLRSIVACGAVSAGEREAA